MKTKPCLVCGRVIDTKPSRGARPFCSGACHAASRRFPVKQCAECSGTFQTTKDRKTFCSSACDQSASGKRLVAMHGPRARVGDTRACPTCGIGVTVTHSMLLRRRYYCAPCLREHTRRSYLRNRQARLDDYRNRRSNEDFLAWEANYLQRTKSDHEIKRAARRAVRRAVASGRLVKGLCKGCGVDSVQAHHSDYSKPLDVQWLCPQCHGREHRKKPSHAFVEELRESA